MRDTTVDFWFTIGSTYTYLTVMRIEEIEAEAGVNFLWRPYSCRVIMTEQNNIPFTGKPVKKAYMWRDIERRAALYGLPVRVPAPYGLTEYDVVNRIAILARAEGWLRPYVKELYRRWFQLGEEPSLPPSLPSTLVQIGQDPERVIAASEREATSLAYKEATDEARRLNVFGSPTFVVYGEVFWGDDRLEDAIRWAKKAPLARDRSERTV
jgi:2-hydroxychromene-2-carboxylate isomerase